MADEHGSSRFRLPWSLPAQRVARRESAPAPFEWRATMRSRLLVCAILFGLWTIGIEARLFFLQVVSHQELTVLADKQHLRTATLPAKRGEILDRNGRVLAYSVDGDTITADPSAVDDPENTARLVCEALDECDAERLKVLTQRLKGDGQFAYLDRGASPVAARRIRDLDLPGIAIYKESRRYYPNVRLAGHLLGFVGTDNRGLAGLESTFDGRIRGRDGRILLQADGRTSKAAKWIREERPATVGDSLELTIDRTLQHIAERELRAGVQEFNAQGGSVVVMDPRNGEILAMANYPDFNPNAYREAPTEARRNRAVQDLYEPGSTFKLVTASAAFEEGLLDPLDPIDCAPGFIKIGSRKPIYDVHRYGVLSFEDVIVKSSNVGAIKAGLQIGAERLSLYINRFGFGQRLSPDFRGESAGMVHSPKYLTDSSVASISMGYEVGVTPLQMAAAVSSVANGGILYQPRVVRAFISGGRREPVEAKPLRRSVSVETAATLTAIMEQVVERGTATKAKIPGYTVAGKTGTAQKLVNRVYSKRDYNVSFVGFAPSREPAIAVVVMIDSPHGRVTAYGGTVAAPIFKRIAEASLRHLAVPPTLNAPPPVIVARASGADVDGVTATPIRAARALEALLEPAREGVMPDLRGLSARQALTSLARIGLTARMAGDGFVVEQLPEAGSALVPGGEAVLKLGRRMPPIRAGGPEQ